MPELDAIQKAIAEGKRIKSLTGNTDHYPIRFIAAYMPSDGEFKGLYRMFHAARGQHTHTTEQEAQRSLEAILANNSAELLTSMFGPIESFKILPVKCYPGHHDPTGTVFEA